ncbi:MAG: hypothetical protein KF893_25725 [Caldilineaceae bacterium]|nr:hypothetical protein [Caldilineaceae bacterium]
MNFVIELWNLFTSPLGPPLMLMVGALTVWIMGRLRSRSHWQSGIALFFWLIAIGQMIMLRLEPVVPIYSQPWQPFLIAGSHLLWVGDGWNWYVSTLLLVLGGVAILLSGFGGEYVGLPTYQERRHITLTLSTHLALLAASLLFVSSGNLLTVTLMWVFKDLFVLARNSLVPLPQLAKGDAANPGSPPLFNRAQGLSLLGALLLLIGLLPAGPGGLAQPLHGGDLPVETVLLLLVAAAIRAGAYPFHIWLLPANSLRLRLPDRFIDQLVPAVCGLWLFGWASELGGAALLVRPEFVILVLIAFLGSAVAAYTATAKPGHTTFVLVTSVGVAGLTSILSESQGPAALIWPTTTIALGGGLWLVGERVWREWGWQIPVSVGALALVGVPFTPGFLTHSAISRLLTGEFYGSLVMPFFALYLLAQTLQVSALLRSWGAQERNASGLALPVIWRLLAACLVLATPLAVAGIFPEVLAAMASIPNAIPRNVGDPPSAVAGPSVWLTLGAPLLLGMALALVRPHFWSFLGKWPDHVSHFAGLEWVSRIFDWGTTSTASLWSAGLEVVEGTGYVGWLVTFVVVGYFLLS